MLNSSLGKLLVGEGLLTETDRQTIRRTCGVSPSAFAKGVLALGVMSEDELTSLLADKTNIPVGPKDLLSEHDNEVFRVIDPSLAARLEVFPISFQKDSLRVALTDPLDRNIIRQLEFFTEKKIKPVIAPLSEIRRCLKQIVRGYTPQPTELEKFLIHHAPSASRQLVVERNPYLRRSERKSTKGAPPSSIRVPGQYTSSEQDDRFAAIDIGPDFAAPPVSGRDRDLESLSFIAKARGGRVASSPATSSIQQQSQAQPAEARATDSPAREETDGPEVSASQSDEFELDADLEQSSDELSLEADSVSEPTASVDTTSLDLVDIDQDKPSQQAEADITSSDLEDLGELDLGASSGSGGIDLSDLDDIGGGPVAEEASTASSHIEAADPLVDIEAQLGEVEDLGAEKQESFAEDLISDGSQGLLDANLDSSDLKLDDVASVESTDAAPPLEEISETESSLAPDASDLVLDSNLDSTEKDASSGNLPDLEAINAGDEPQIESVAESNDELSIGSVDELEFGEIPIQAESNQPDELQLETASNSLDISPAAESELSDIGSIENLDINDPTQVLSTLNQAMIRSSLSLPGPQNLQTVAGAFARHLNAGMILSTEDGLRVVAHWEGLGASIKTNIPLAADELQATKDYIKGISMPWMAILGDDARILPKRLADLQVGDEPVLVCVVGKSILVTSCSLDLIRNEAFQLAIQTLLKKLEAI